MSTKDSVLSRMRRRHKISNRLARNLLAEFFCTGLHMLLGFCINAQTVLSRLQMNGSLGMALGWGLALIFAVQAGYKISGSHLNPAVSFFVWSFGQLTFTHFLLYSLAQTAGAFCGAALTFVIYYEKINEYDGGVRAIIGPNATAGIFATYPGSHLSLTMSMVDQVACTAVLCFIIGIITDERTKIPRAAHPILFGLMLTTISLAMGLNAGNGMNPARDFGPRLFTSLTGWGSGVFSYRAWRWFMVPIICPLIGAFIGAWTYQLTIGCNNPTDDEDSSNTSSGSEIDLIPHHKASLPLATKFDKPAAV